jgi:8-oxo-dGTP pyrophosphatase MutT (NUDIX family)
MQVYLMVNDGTRYLIIKKGPVWTYRDNARVHGDQKINGGGNWGLPGGGQDCSTCHKPLWKCTCGTARVIETAEQTARREMLEESGVDINAYAPTLTVYTPPTTTTTPTPLYAVVKARVSVSNLDAIRNSAAINTAADPLDGNLPAIRNSSSTVGVKDWEWDQPTLIDKAQLSNYLGNSSAGEPWAYTGPKHSITWYKDIALAAASW